MDIDDQFNSLFFGFKSITQKLTKESAKSARKVFRRYITSGE